MNSHGSAEQMSSLSESLTDTEYDRLGAILDSFRNHGAMNMEEMDGFFAALVCGPVTVLPNEYLPEIWGRGDAPFEEMDGLQEFLNLAMRHWNFLARQLQSKDTIFVPWLKVNEGEELPRGNRWAHGFLRGIDMRREEWEEIFADEDKFAMLLAVLAPAHENDPNPEMRTWQTPPSAEVRESVCVGLAVSAQRLYDYFRPHRMPEARRGTAAVSERKIGRNELCFCGSGKKYKRCCGNVTIN